MGSPRRDRTIAHRWRDLAIPEQVVWARRVLPVAIFLVVVSVQLFLNLIHTGGDSLVLHLSAEVVVYALLGPAVMWVVLHWIERQLKEKERVERRLREQEQRMLQIADDVRAEIANDLHDQLGPHLFALGLKVDVCRKLLPAEPEQVATELHLIKDGLKQSVHEVRRAVYALRPIELESLGFFDVLYKMEADYREVGELGFHLSITGEDTPLSDEVEVGLFHIVQEALYNVRRHARASNVWVDVDANRTSLHLAVRDDGRGFDADRVSEGVGLSHMRARCEALGGTFSLESQPGEGTLIRIDLPLKRGKRK